MSDLIADYKFFHTVRVQREILANPRSEKSRKINSWAERIAFQCKLINGEAITLYFPDLENSNRIFVCGDSDNTALAAKLLRKAVIEISNDTFDHSEMMGFLDQAIINYKKEKMHAARPLPTCRIDFQIPLQKMDARQTRSFERLTSLFDKIGVTLSHPENRPRSIEISCESKAILKAARLTAEWAAQSIGQSYKLTPNQITQTYVDKSFQALGRERGKPVAELVMA